MFWPCGRANISSRVTFDIFTEPIEQQTVELWNHGLFRMLVSLLRSFSN